MSTNAFFIENHLLSVKDLLQKGKAVATAGKYIEQVICQNRLYAEKLFDT
jgi:hypothetical protein